MTTPTETKRQTVQHNIEDKTFKTLIRRYTKERDWEFVQSLFLNYGRVLQDRLEKAASDA